MDYLVYSLIAAGVIVGSGLGWFFRHRILDRQLFQTRKQLNDMKALQMNLEHEVSAVRQRLIQQEDHQTSMKSRLQDAESQQHKADEALRRLEEMQERLASIQQDNEELEEQVAYLEAEKSNLQKFREQSQEKMQQIASENRQLRDMISELHHTGSQRSAGAMREDMPLVRRVPPPETATEPSAVKSGREIRSQPSTSRIKTRQAESTDRVKTRQAADALEIPQDQPHSRQAPTSAIPVRSEDMAAGVHTDGTGTPALHSDTPAPSKRSTDRFAERSVSEEPALQKAEVRESSPEDDLADEDTGVRELKNEVPAATKPASQIKPKKKPKTVRIDRSTSDIIDSFKRDLGLPGK